MNDRPSLPENDLERAASVPDADGREVYAVGATRREAVEAGTPQRLPTGENKQRSISDPTVVITESPLDGDEVPIAVGNDAFFKSVALRLVAGALITGFVIAAILLHNAREWQDQIVATRVYGRVVEAIGQQRIIHQRISEDVEKLANYSDPVRAHQLQRRLVQLTERWDRLQDAIQEYGLEPEVTAAKGGAIEPLVSQLLGLASAEEVSREQAKKVLAVLADYDDKYAVTLEAVNARHSDRLEQAANLQFWMELLAVLAMITAVIGITLPSLAYLRHQTHVLREQAGQLQLLSRVARCTTNAVAMTDIDGRITWINPGYRMLSGYNEEELLGSAWPAWLERRSPRTNHMREICAAIADGTGLRCQTEKRHRSGETYHVEVDIQPLYTENSQLNGFQFVETDITHQKITERRLRENREYLDATMMSIGDGVISTDDSGKVTYLNPVAEKLTGWTNRDANGVTIEEVFRTTLPADHTAPISLVRKVLNASKSESSTMRLRLISKSGEPLTVSTRCTPMAGSLGQICGAVIIFRDVTKEYAAQEALREINERFETATIAAGFGVWDWDYQQSEFHWGQACYRIFHLDEDPEVDPAKAWRATIHPEDRKSVENAFQQAVEDKTELDIEFRANCGDGQTREIRMYGRIAQGKQGEALKLTGIFTDITAQRAAERELQREHQRAESALEGGNLGLFDWNLKTNEVVYDQRWASIVGEKIESLEMHLDAWQSRIHPDDRLNVEKIWNEHLRDPRRQFRSIHRIRHNSGVWRWLLACGRVVDTDADGQPLRMVGTVSDITRERQTQLDLERSENALAATTRMTRVGWWELDAELSQWTLSETVRGIFEIPEWSVIDHRELMKAFQADDQQELVANLDKALEDGEPFQLELPVSLSGGQKKWIRVIGQFDGTKGQTNAKLLGAIQDITQSRVRQLELEKAKSHAEKLAGLAEAAARSKSDFLANMSHELRTPLTAILGFTDILTERASSDEGTGGVDEAHVEMLQTIRRNGDHLLSLINDVLDVSKVEAGQMEVESLPCSVTQCVDDVVNLMKCKADDKGIQLIHTFGSQVPKTFYSDPVRVKQILVNLVGNAIKFTDKGEVHLVVSVDRSSSTEPRLLFRVIDTGIGMNASQLDRLFQPFSQGDSTMTRRFGGTGLGLVISKRLANLMGGDIEVRSEQGKGSTFTASITCKTDDQVEWILPDSHESQNSSNAARKCRSSTSASLPNFDGLRVLVAEDGPDNQRLLRFLLRKVNCEAVIVNNGSETLDVLTDQWTKMLEPAPFDIVLMDMQMPVMDGYTATERLKQLGCDIPIVALTAHAMSGDREKCYAVGCNDYVTKPIDRQVLFDVLRKHCTDVLERQSRPSASSSQTGSSSPSAEAGQLLDGAPSGAAASASKNSPTPPLQWPTSDSPVTEQ